MVVGNLLPTTCYNCFNFTSQTSANPNKLKQKVQRKYRVNIEKEDKRKQQF